MRRMMVVASVLLAIQALAYEGPKDNPEDQIRYFGLFPRVYYPELLEAGFNLFGYLQETPNDPRGAEWDQIEMEMLDRLQADGVEYIIRCDFNRQVAKKHPRIAKNGLPVPKRLSQNLDTTDPAYRAEAIALALKKLEQYQRHPAIAGLTPSGEIRDDSLPSFTPVFSNAWSQASGGKAVPPEVEGRIAPHYLTLADFPKSRVVPDDYPLLKFYEWFWRKGDGWNDYQDEMCAAFAKTLGAGQYTGYSPAVRCPPLWRADSGSCEYQGQWTYANPLPYSIAYVVAEQQEMAKGRPGTKIISDVQGICYRSRMAPKNVTVTNPPSWLAERPNAQYVTVPADLAVEAFWSLFARRLDGIGTYGWRSLFDSSVTGIAKTKVDYQFTDPTAWPAIKELFKTVAVPLGPLFRAVPERTPRVAILESHASTILAGRGSWGWSGEIYHTGILATKANLMPSALYEEDIVSNGIPDSVKVILAPTCDVLTESVFRELKRFQARGGMIVADRFLVPGIRPDALLPDFNMHGTPRAEKLAKDIQRAADELNAMIAPVYAPYVTSETKDLIFHVRSSGSADYLFAINDKRRAGTNVGQWGLCREIGCPNSGTIRIARAAGAVYDLVRHQPVPFRSSNGVTEIDVSYTTSDGRLYLVTAAPLRPLQVSREDGRTIVRSPDDEVMIPIALKIPGRKNPLYGVVRNGRWVREGLPAGVQVVNLADGSLAVEGRGIVRSEKIEQTYANWVERGIDPLNPTGRRQLRPFKIALSRDPANDHEIIRVKSQKLSVPEFTLPAAGDLSAVELWLSPFKSFSLSVNGEFVGDYEALMNPALSDVHVDITPYVRWDAKNTFELVGSDGKPFIPWCSLELLRVGH